MAVNVVSIFALALAIDYATLVINRFRDELAQGLTVPRRRCGTTPSGSTTCRT
ncbi:MAG: MMPL family transporter [Actinoallomurus sp.]